MNMKKPEVVVITGGTAGVGRATVQRFARDGAHIGIVARGEERLNVVREEVEELGGKAITLAGDVSDPSVTERLAAMTEEAFGPIDIWINNAMTSVYSKIWDMPPDEFRRVTEVTYLGVVYGTQAALRRMLPRNRGTILQVGSSLAYRSIPFQSAYCAAKHAIRGFTNSLRSELMHDKKALRLSMVHLPSVNTPQFLWVKNRLPEAAKPPAPIYQPCVAANAIHWAAHHYRREWYVGYQTSLGIKLNKLAPAFFDRYLVNRSFGHTGRPRNPNAPDNLWHPVPGDFGVRGPFNGDAQDHSYQLKISQHRKPLTLALLGIAGVALAAYAGKRALARV